jgi:hypothetical protein
VKTPTRQKTASRSEKKETPLDKWRQTGSDPLNALLRAVAADPEAGPWAGWAEKLLGYEAESKNTCDIFSVSSGQPPVT